VRDLRRISQLLGKAETSRRSRRTKSTLAYANKHRPWGLYQAVFQQLLAKSQAAIAGGEQKKKFRFKNKSKPQ
jgi:hypothetical protein